MRAYNSDASFCWSWLQISHSTDTFTNSPCIMYAWNWMFYVNFKMPVAMALVCALLVDVQL